MYKEKKLKLFITSWIKFINLITFYVKITNKSIFVDKTTPD